jgi:hypothetical protein
MEAGADNAATPVRTSGAVSGDGGASTRTLLRLGVVAGPFYLAVGLAQAFVREGFDFARHPLSVLANGPGGWVQTANFVLTGLMVAEHKTVSGINREFALTTDQSCLNRWLTEVQWDVTALNDRRLAWLQQLR